MTNQVVIINFIEGSTRGVACHLYIYNNELINYSTTIAKRMNDGTFRVNSSKYSRTTSKIQSTLKYELEKRGIKYTEYEGNGCYLWNCGFVGAPSIKSKEVY